MSADELEKPQHTSQQPEYQENNTDDKCYMDQQAQTAKKDKTEQP
jgi:hypothetical protein